MKWNLTNKTASPNPSSCSFILRALFLIFSFMILSSFCFVALAAEEAPASTDFAVEELTLKMKVVNPSEKFKQTFPMKAYLPEEVRPEYILDKEDMKIDYDEERGAYFVHLDLELEPGEAVVKTVTLKDVWNLAEPELHALSEEANDLLNSLIGTKYEDQGKLLLSNVEVLLIQIFESQHDEGLSPEQHISAYRENKAKKDNIEMDLMALRRFVVTAGVDPGVSFLKGKGKDGNKGGESSGGLALPGVTPNWKAEEDALDQAPAKKEKGSGKGQIPAWMLWRIIFAVLFFISGLTLIFFVVWVHQIATIKKRKRMDLKTKSSSKDPLGFGDDDEAPLEQVRLGDFIQTETIIPDKGKE